ncbi:MAG: hypothetical protein H7A47_06750 [Verrucomicrobiales bacterium]|nr:hypothetical protein [Verrucomicrobiales bacterium]
MITRKLGSIIRGQATPFQLLSACILGSVLGFMPGWMQAPGAILALTGLLVVLNANLALAGLVAVGAKLLALALAPVGFAAGRFLLDGPTRGLFEWLINAPGFALFGFDYYLTTGGLALGGLVGVVLGGAVVLLVGRYRRKMADLEQNSERFQQFQSRKSVRLLVWLLAGGGKGGKSYEELLSRRIGNPIRVLGLVLVILVAVLVVLVNQFATGPILRAGLQRGLEGANGATADVEAVELDLKGNRLTVRGLAVADPNALDTDLFRAAQLEADISTRELLRKRLALDRVVVSDASSGETRAVPGRSVGPTPEPVVEPDVPAETRTIDDYLRDAQKWKERLAQVREWLDKLSGPEAGSGATPEETQETLRERLEREVREKGYARVRASHLVEGRPTFTIGELTIEKMRLAGLEGETLNVSARNLSTHPALLGRVPEIAVDSSAGTMDFRLTMGRFAAQPTNNLIHFAWRGLPTDRIAGDLKIGGQRPLQGGTIDLSGTGQWGRGPAGIEIDFPLQATLHNVDLTLPTGDATKLDEFVLPIGLSGPLDRPRVQVDDSGLSQALLAAGKQRALSEAQNRAGELLDKEVGGQLGEQGKGLLNNLLGGQKKPR